MTAPHRTARSPELAIGGMTVRGRGLAPAAGHDLAAAVAEALARQLTGHSRHFGAIAVRMPASVVDAEGGIDRAAVAEAIARAGQTDA